MAKNETKNEPQPMTLETFVLAAIDHGASQVNPKTNEPYIGCHVVATRLPIGQGGKTTTLMQGLSDLFGLTDKEQRKAALAQLEAAGVIAIQPVPYGALLTRPENRPTYTRSSVPVDPSVALAFANGVKPSTPAKNSAVETVAQLMPSKFHDWKAADQRLWLKEHGSAMDEDEYAKAVSAMTG